jgi:phage head maturation protease
MRFCQNHWNMLRENVDKQGLTNWVAPDGETALMQIADEIAKGKITQTNYDPLMSCHNMIIARTVEMVGLSDVRSASSIPSGQKTDVAPVSILLAEEVNLEAFLRSRFG